MITKVTKENKALYEAWFEKARQESQLSDITSLDNYFAAITALREKNPVFTILPLDEPTFDIDANSRIVKVPEEFKKNGISVQGDEMSEIVYFTIDRYFDTTDLADKDINIVIQWEIPGPDKTHPICGVSKECIRDITTRSADHKMIFGWALNSHITQHPGTIKFAVRFYKLQEIQQELTVTFSLSTLVQTANINPSLDYKIVDGEFNQEIYDDKDILASRLKDSQTPPGLDIAGEPYFIYDMPNNLEGNSSFTADCWGVSEEGEGEEKKTYYLIDLKDRSNEAGELTAPGYLLSVSAVSPDAGHIGYNWYRSPLIGRPGIDNTALESKEAFHLTKDTIYSKDHIYFHQGKVVPETGVPAYTVWEVPSDLIGTEIPAEDKAMIYEKFNECDATKTGYYRVEAVNRVGIAKHAKEGLLVKIPGPEALTLKYVPEQVHTLLNEKGQATLTATGSTGQVGDKVVYAWDDNNDGNNLHDFTAEQGTKDSYSIPDVSAPERAMYDKTITLKTYATRNTDRTDVKEVSFRITDKAHNPVVDVANSSVMKKKGSTVKISVKATHPDCLSDKITYQWYKMKDDSEGAGDPENPLANDILVDGATKPDYMALDAQVYYCIVTNHVNGSTAVVKSDNILVSDII